MPRATQQSGSSTSVTSMPVAAGKDQRGEIARMVGQFQSPRLGVEGLLVGHGVVAFLGFGGQRTQASRKQGGGRARGQKLTARYGIHAGSGLQSP